MKSLKLLATLLVFGVATTASAAQYKFSGDLNNRFMLYTDQATLYSGAETIATGATVVPRQTIANGTIGETWGEIKYRLTLEVATDDSAVKGIYGLELGAIRFGDTTAGTAGQRGGGYSGDGNNYETRFAYVDFAIAPKHRFQVGLQPFLVNKYLWSETAMGVSFKGQGGPLAYTLAWMRGNEIFNTTTSQQLFRDADALLLRGDFIPMKDTKVGAFGLYQHSSPELVAAPPATAANRSHLLKRFTGVEYDLYNIGVDGAVKAGPAFFNFDLIYQGGNSTAPSLVAAAAREQDHKAFFGHLDLGYNFGPARVTYTGWYASGDDNAADTDTKNFIATDVDINDSIVLFEGGYVDDNYFTEAPYFLTAGAVFNKLALDFKASDKLTLSGAVMYIMTAKDLTIGTGATAGRSKKLGTEIDAAVAYKVNPNMELAVNGGYLIAGDGMDAFEVNRNGESGRNILRTTARARYTF